MMFRCWSIFPLSVNQLKALHVSDEVQRLVYHNSEEIRVQVTVSADVKVH